MKARQRARDRSRLAAARQSRSVHVIAGRWVRRLEDGEFVPQYDNFQVFELVRPNAPDRELQDPPKRRLTQREKHETSDVPILRGSLGLVSFLVAPGCADARSDFCTLQEILGVEV